MAAKRVRRPKIFDEDTPFVETVGMDVTPLRDLYHRLLRSPLLVFGVFIAGLFLVANLIFAGLFVLTGAQVSEAPITFLEAFFFSVHTMATIGYGDRYPMDAIGNHLVVAEAIVGILITAVSTGLIFARFSRLQAALRFSEVAVIELMNGKPTLKFRVANMRGTYVLNAIVKLTVLRTEEPDEGGTMYRMHDLPPIRERTPMLSRTWTVMHVIDEESPIFDYDPERMSHDEVEVIIVIVGIDEITGQNILAKHSYLDTEIRWNERFKDIIHPTDDGKVRIDYSTFDETEECATRIPSI